MRPEGRAIAAGGPFVQQLHPVGFTADLAGLIFSARKGTTAGGFTVPVDEHLIALIEEVVRLRRSPADEGDAGAGAGPAPAAGIAARLRPRPHSALSPREIQGRLRAGRSVESVAAEAGVDGEWVARFAAPVLAEQAKVVARARTLVYVKPRLGPSAQPLGVSVRWNAAERDVRLAEDEFDAAWSAYQVRDNLWVVRFSFVSRRRRQDGEW
ncbi:MAG: septation protein SepH, partial [Acidimicrobiales bacterium]